MISTKSGIYQIRNLINNRIYIGSSVNLRNRKQEHFKDLELKKHHNVALQRAYNKYGKSNFVFEILQFVDNKSDLLGIEQSYIDNIKPDYNIYKVAGSSFGHKHSDEYKEKKSLLNRGEKNPKAKLKDSDIYNILELKDTMSNKDIAKLYKVHFSTIERIINGRAFKHLNVGKLGKKRILPDESRKKISDSRKGNKTRSTPIKVFDRDNNFIGEFESITDFCKKYKYDISCVIENLHRGNNHKRRYKIYKIDDDVKLEGTQTKFNF